MVSPSILQTTALAVRRMLLELQHKLPAVYATLINNDFYFVFEDGSVHFPNITFSPDMSKELFGVNHPLNRKISKETVKQYKKAATKNTFKTVYGETVILDVLGRMIAGQHRVVMSMETGLSFVGTLAINAPESVMSNTNMGRKQSVTDRFVHEGFDRSIATQLAGTIRAVAILENTEIAKTDDVPALAVAERDLLIEAVSKGKRFGKAWGVTPSIMAALFVIGARRDKKKADLFFEDFGNISVTDKYNPAVALRARLNTSDNKKPESYNEALFLGKKALINYFNGTRVSQIRRGANETLGTLKWADSI